jgi:hypothetical protein
LHGAGGIAYTWLGHAGHAALTGESDAIRYGLIALGLLAAIALLPRFIKRLRSPFGWMEVSDLEQRLAGGQPMRSLTCADRMSSPGLWAISQRPAIYRLVNLTSGWQSLPV